MGRIQNPSQGLDQKLALENDISFLLLHLFGDADQKQTVGPFGDGDVDDHVERQPVLHFAVFSIQDVDGTVGDDQHAFTSLVAASVEFGDTHGVLQQTRNQLMNDNTTEH